PDYAQQTSAAQDRRSDQREGKRDSGGRLMRIEAIFMLGIGVFFGIVGIVYWFTSYEDAGFLMLIGTTGLGLLPGAYYFWWSRHMKVRPEDDPNATVENSAG